MPRAASRVDRHAVRRRPRSWSSARRHELRSRGAGPSPEAPADSARSRLRRQNTAVDRVRAARHVAPRRAGRSEATAALREQSWRVPPMCRQHMRALSESTATRVGDDCLSHGGVKMNLELFARDPFFFLRCTGSALRLCLLHGWGRIVGRVIHYVQPLAVDQSLHVHIAAVLDRFLLRRLVRAGNRVSTPRGAGVARG